MKLTLLFGALLCLIAVNARNIEEGNDGEALENEEELLRRSREHSPLPRHRRRRWQMNYGYDYPPLPYYQYPERREYDRNNQELLQQISRLLEELSTYVHRPPPPPPPPQPIYIPYPIPYPRVSCNPANGDSKVNVSTRNDFLKGMDSNRIWGVAVTNDDDYDDGGDGSRPISFDPIVPKQVMKRPAPKVEHGSLQAAHSTEAPRYMDDAPAASARFPTPGTCTATILSCCGISLSKSQKQQCFDNLGCSSTYADGSGCSSDSIQRALNSFSQAYAPL